MLRQDIYRVQLLTSLRKASRRIALGEVLADARAGVEIEKKDERLIIRDLARDGWIYLVRRKSGHYVSITMEGRYSLKALEKAFGK